ncbi:MAG: hypothetical protein KAH57_05320 [Thermoplasmata archaeon]|nr:hypothetical protein [Thermoplasmata archaeon]
MEPLRDGTWSDYYKKERSRRDVELRDYIREAWSVTDDDGPLEVLERGGALSFPHTYIDGSLEALIRTIRAIYRSGKKKVLAMGVLHRGNYGRLDLEFSLDGFRELSILFSQELGLTPLEIDEVFMPLHGRVDDDLSVFVEDHVRFGRELQNRVDDDTAIVLTGDLTHFGHGYGVKVIPEDHEGMIYRNIGVMLDLLYVKRDLLSFVEMAKERLNDQIANGTALASLLEGDLDHRIFYHRLSDYSEVLGSKEPTVVASVFYGVWPR